MITIFDCSTCKDSKTNSKNKPCCECDSFNLWHPIYEPMQKEETKFKRINCEDCVSYQNIDGQCYRYIYRNSNCPLDNYNAKPKINLDMQLNESIKIIKDQIKECAHKKWVNKIATMGLKTSDERLATASQYHCVDCGINIFDYIKQLEIERYPMQKEEAVKIEDLRIGQTVYLHGVERKINLLYSRKGENDRVGFYDLMDTYPLSDVKLDSPPIKWYQHEYWDDNVYKKVRGHSKWSDLKDNKNVVPILVDQEVSE